MIQPETPAGAVEPTQTHRRIFPAELCQSLRLRARGRSEIAAVNSQVQGKAWFFRVVLKFLIGIMHFKSDT